MKDALNILRGLAVAPVSLLLCAALLVLTEEQRKPWRRNDGR